VIAANPNGASRARQYLARVCLQEGKWEDAERFARECLQTGRYQAKTVAAWQLLLTSRAAQGKPPLDELVYRGLLSSQNGSVAARAILSITTQLRSRRDSAWKSLAKEWIAKRDKEDPVVGFELKKMLLSEYRLAGESPEDVHAWAAALLDDKMVSGRESVAIAKAIVEYGLLAQLDGDNIAAEVEGKIHRRFGDQTAAEANHAMALGAMMAKSHDLARIILNRQLAKLPIGSAQWGKDQWALARMEGALGNRLAEADAYLAFAEATAIPAQFRLQAFLRWVAATEKAGAVVNLDQVEARVRAVLADIQDYRTLLDAARQLALAGSRFRAIRQLASAEGEQKALARLQQLDDAILHNLLRINNFFKTQQIAADMPRFSSAVSASTSYAN
jgi:hypothetical protein